MGAPPEQEKICTSGPFVPYSVHMDTETAQIARRVEQARRTKEVTEVALSDATGTPRSTLKRQLAGLADFKVIQLLRISRHLGVSVGSLLTGVSDEAAQSRLPLMASPVTPLAYSMDHAAAAVGVSVRSLYRIIEAGDLNVQFVNSKRVIAADELRAYVKSLPYALPGDVA